MWFNQGAPHASVSRCPRAGPGACCLQRPRGGCTGGKFGGAYIGANIGYARHEDDKKDLQLIGNNFGEILPVSVAGTVFMDVNNDGGEISSAHAFTVAARSLDNSNGKLLSNQAVTLRIDQALTNLKGLIAAAGREDLQKVSAEIRHLALFDRAEAYGQWRAEAQSLAAALPALEETEARRRWRGLQPGVNQFGYNYLQAAVRGGARTQMNTRGAM